MGNRGTGSSRRLVGNAVLLLCNDREVCGLWAYALRQMGLKVRLAATAAEAVSRWAKDPFDLMVVDVCGPELDGIELVRSLRAEAVSPILLFTTNRDEAHILEAYQAGVDECCVKPVSPSLFLAKVRAWLRRTWTVPAGALASLQAGEWCLDPSRRTIVLDGGATVALTNLEFRLLYLLMSNPCQALPADLILDRVWGYSGGDSKVLKNLVYRLRRKIELDPSRPRYLQTVAGGGYIFSP